MAEARAGVAAVLTADVDDVALTHATTEGMNIGVWGVDWRPATGPSRRATSTRAASGAVHRATGWASTSSFADIGDGSDDDEALDAFDARHHARTKLVVDLPRPLDDGRRSAGRPDRRARACPRRTSSVDGAQAVGAIPVDLAATSASTTTPSPAQKWLLGPEGMGAVAVRIGGTSGSARVRRLVHVRAASTRRDGRSTAGRTTLRGDELPPAIGRRDGPLDRLAEHVRRPRRGSTSAARRWPAARPTASRRSRVKVLTPRDRMATLVTFRIERLDAGGGALDELGARVFAIARTIPLARRPPDQRRLLHTGGRRSSDSPARRASSPRTRPRRSRPGAR